MQRQAPRRESKADAPLKQSALPNASAAHLKAVGGLPVLPSAANSPRKLTKTNTLPGPGAGAAAAGGPAQLSAAERVRLRQQAAAVGAVERLKQRKAWGAAQDRAAAQQQHQQLYPSASQDTIPAVRAAPSLPALAPALDSRRSSLVHHLSSSPSFIASSHDDEGEWPGGGRASCAGSIAAHPRSQSPLAASGQQLAAVACEPRQPAGAAPGAHAHGPLHTQDNALGLLLHRPSPSRRSSATQLEEGDLPLAVLAASRRQSRNADSRGGLVPSEGSSVPPGSPAPALQEAALPSSLPRAGCAAQPDCSGAASNAAAVPWQDACLPPASAAQPPTAGAGIEREGEGTAEPVSEAQPSGRGILEKLAALKGLQRSSPPASSAAADPQQPFEASGQGCMQDGQAPPAAVVAAPSAAAPQSQLSSSGRGPSRMQSLLQQHHHRDRSRLSVDGNPEQQSSPGRAQQQQLTHSNTFPASRFQQQLVEQQQGEGGDSDALAAFEEAAQQGHGAAAGEGPGVGTHHRQGSTYGSSAAAGAARAERAYGAVPAGDALSTLLEEPASSQGQEALGGFTIPCCPAGRVLQIAIHTTWGDQHYVGLAGVEVFDASGQAVMISDPKSQVTADPASINVLPEYGSDPRTPDKLVDGVYLTCDDSHVWLAPFTPGALHTVSIAFDLVVTLGMLRIFNYNKNRIHSLRGARHVDITLDGTLIFTGELQQAPGNVPEALQHAEAILFTDSPAALERIEELDARRAAALLEAGSRASPPAPDSHASDNGASSGWAQPAAAAVAELDLVTGSQSPRARPALPSMQPAAASLLSRTVTGGRPLTAANTAAALASQPDPVLEWAAAGRSRSAEAASAPQRCSSASQLLRCRQLVLVLLDTHGDSHFVGLSGLEVVGADGAPLPLTPASVWADPADLNVFPGHSGDVRTVDKLVDGENNTLDDAHMWLAPVKRQLAAGIKAQAGQGHATSTAVPDNLKHYNLLGLTLGSEPVPIPGLRVWNYNKNLADTSRGAKRCIVLADGIEVSPPGGVLLRKAPGTAALDFGQLIPLSTMWQREQPSSSSSSSRASMPGGPATSTSSSSAAAAAGARRRTTMQGGGKHSSQPSAQGGSGTLGSAVTAWDETTAWVCNMPDPVAAAEYLQRSAAWRKNNTLHQPTESFSTPLPCGFALKFVVLTSWGDPHYVGLTGIEIQDAVRGPLQTDPSQVLAVPSSVALLQGMGSDVRTPDKLVDGDNSGSAMHSWLAPLSPDEGNCVYVTYDEPVLLGAIRVWNYAKTPARGVQELEIYLDDQLVFKGVLQKAPDTIPTAADFSQTLCFCEEAVQGEMRRRVAQAKLGETQVDSVAEWLNKDCVVLVNDGQFVQPGSASGGRRTGDKAAAAVAALRPITAAV